MSGHNFSLNESIIAGLVAQLNAQMPTAIATVNADVEETFQIIGPAELYAYMPLLTTVSSRGFPAIAIEDLGSTIEDDLVSSVTGRHRIAVVGLVASQDPEVLAWQLRRYQQAIMLAIQFDRTLGGACWTTTFLGVAPGPFLAPAERPDQDYSSSFVSWVAIEIECVRSEV